MTPPWQAVALVGATGAGKSALAEALARHTGGEIVACDSVQIYRGFDVGSAKASRAVRRCVPHHLVDVADWWAPWSVADWRAGAERALLDIRARGRLPILAGGTGLYLRALVRGLAPLPAADRAHQARLAARERAAPGTLIKAIAAADPNLAPPLAGAPLRRQVRALELCERLGEPPSAVFARHRRAPPAWRIRVLVVSRPAAEVRARLARRARAMLAAGLVAEVRAHLAAGVAPQSPPLAAVGYRQVVAWLARGAPAGADLAGEIAAASWAYARRQATWWRREPEALAWPAGAADPDACAIAAELGAHVYPAGAATPHQG